MIGIRLCFLEERIYSAHKTGDSVSDEAGDADACSRMLAMAYVVTLL
jgi:hypothetical protein